MATKKQKEIFLSGEGDAWFERNHVAVRQYAVSAQDPVVNAIMRCRSCDQEARHLLEVGCGEGGRLDWLGRKLGLECHGIDPSEKAIAFARSRGLQVIHGTADKLPYQSGFFDIIVFGFCLYLCDREDLFRIAQEADRVLKSKGWVVIHDFFSIVPMHYIYKHCNGVFSYKMDYRKLFDWHPSYVCFSHNVSQHGIGEFTDDALEWIGTSVLRKNLVL